MKNSAQRHDLAGGLAPLTGKLNSQGRKTGSDNRPDAGEVAVNVLESLRNVYC